MVVSFNAVNLSTKINIIMKHQYTADKFFDNVDYVSIIDTVKGIYTSDGSMNVLLDFERVLDESDLYAYRNWELGELVQGPDVRRYSVSCVFMWPYDLMPNPKGGRRLVAVGCKVKFAKSKIKVPIEVEDYADYVPGTRYPKMVERSVWFVYIEIPKELLDDIKEGSIDLAGQTIDLEEIDNAYDQDLDQSGTQDEEQSTAPDTQGQPVAPMPAM
jgi:hypothetical protein